ncbi:MAG: hypothetical protein JWO49_2742 [Arthrobacter sp.]|nr:hypothetical protein [Arthrobacter sp.]
MSLKACAPAPARNRREMPSQPSRLTISPNVTFRDSAGRRRRPRPRRVPLHGGRSRQRPTGVRPRHSRAPPRRTRQRSCYCFLQKPLALMMSTTRFRSALGQKRHLTTEDRLCGDELCIGSAAVSGRAPSSPARQQIHRMPKCAPTSTPRCCPWSLRPGAYWDSLLPRRRSPRAAAGLQGR